MDPFTTGALIGIGTRFLLERLAKSRDRDCSADEVISAHATGCQDRLGELWEVTFLDTVPEGSIAFFRVFDRHGHMLRGRDGFCDDDGDFRVLAEVRSDQCRAYIPFAGPLATHPGPHTILVTTISAEPDGPPRLVGRTMFEHEMREKPHWDYGEYWLPVIRLGMYVVLADGELSRDSLQAIRKQCRFGYVPSRVDDDQMQASLKRARDDTPAISGTELAQIVAVFQNRFPQITAYEAAEMLADIGSSDRPMSAKRIEALRRISECFDLNGDAWRSFARTHGLDIDEYLILLGLSANASKSEIRAAYLREVRVWHPDLFANSSDTERLAAEKRTRELRQAYDTLIARLT